MRNRFGTAQYLSGEVYRDPNQPEEPNKDSRTWTETAIDTASDFLGAAATIPRTITHAMRAGTAYLPEKTAIPGTPGEISEVPIPGQDVFGTPASGVMRDIDVGMGEVEKNIRDWQSPYSKELAKASVLPGYGERSFWDTPFASTGKFLAGSAPYAILALATGGGSLVAQGTGVAAQGVFGQAEGWNQLQDYTDQTPREKLLKDSPVFEEYLRQYPGDEKAARQALYNDTVDLKAQFASGIANAAEFGALLDGLNKSKRSLALGMARFIPVVGKFLPARVGRAVGGTLEGGVSGFAEGATDAYISELAKVRTGEQEAINVSEIPKGGWQGAGFGPGVGAWHAIAPSPVKEWDKGILQTLGSQINGGTTQQQPAPGQGTPPAGGPGAPPPGGPAGAPGAMPPGGPGAAPPGGPTPGGGPTRRRGPVTDVEDTSGQPTAPLVVPGRQIRPEELGVETGQQAAAPLDRAPPMPDDFVPEGDPAYQFTTGKGSRYWHFDDNTTVRNKAPRPEHPGDQGFKAKSETTFYANEDHLNQMGSLMQATSTFGKVMAQHPRTGQWGVMYTSGPSKGKWERRTMGTVSTEPQVGLYPVETWNRGKRFHFGNAITEVKPLRAAAPAAAAGAAAPATPTAPAAAAPAQPYMDISSQEVGPPTQPAGPATWAAGDFQYDVEVTPAPPEQGPDGRMYQQVLHEGQAQWVPADELTARADRSRSESPEVEKARRAFEQHEGRASAQQMRQAAWQQESDRLYNAWKEAEMEERREGAGLPRKSPVAPRSVSAKALTKDQILKIRAGMAVLDPDTRRAFATNLHRRQSATQDVDRHSIPEWMSAEGGPLTDKQYAALANALDNNPDQTIELIGQRPFETTREGVQEHYTQRVAERKEAEAEEAQQAEEATQRARGERRPSADVTIPDLKRPPRRVTAELNTEMQALEASLRGYQVNRKQQTPQRWRALRRRAELIDRELQAQGFQPRFVNWLGPAPAETVRAAGITGPSLAAREQKQAFEKTKRRLRRPKTSVSERVLQRRRNNLANDIAAFNEKLGTLSDPKTGTLHLRRPAARAERQALLDRIQKLGDPDNIMSRALLDLKPVATPTERFNQITNQLEAMGHLSSLEFVRSPQVYDLLTEMQTINAERERTSRQPLPVPAWLQKKIRTGQARARLPKPVNENIQRRYETARSWYMQRMSREWQEVIQDNAPTPVYDFPRPGGEEAQLPEGTKLSEFTPAGFRRVHDVRWDPEEKAWVPKGEGRWQAKGDWAGRVANIPRHQGEVTTETAEPQARKWQAKPQIWDPKREVWRDMYPREFDMRRQLLDVKPLPLADAEQRAAEERYAQAYLARREAAARQRAIEGKPPLVGKEKLPTLQEMIEKFRKGRYKRSRSQQATDLKADYYVDRELEYRNSIWTQLKRSFGGPEKMQAFLMELMAVSARRFPAQPEELRHRAVAEKGRQLAIPMTPEEAVNIELYGTPAQMKEAEQLALKKSERNVFTIRQAQQARPETVAEREARELAEFTGEAKRARATAAPKVSQFVLNKYHEEVDAYYVAKEKQYAMTRRLQKFLDDAIARTQKDILSFTKKNNITAGRGQGSINWLLPEPKRERREIPGLAQMTKEEAEVAIAASIMEVMNKKQYAVGVNNPRFDWYNIATDMLKLSETLRHALAGAAPAFDAKLKIRDQFTGEDVTRFGTGVLPQDIARRYLVPLSATRTSSGLLADYLLDLHAMANLDLDTIRYGRKLRSEATTDRYTEAGILAGVEGELAQERLDELIARQSDLPEQLLLGGSKAMTTKEKPDDQVVQNIYEQQLKDQQEERERLKKRGDNRTLDEIRQEQAEALAKEFPLSNTAVGGVAPRRPFTGVARKTEMNRPTRVLTDAQYAKYGRRVGIGDVVTPAMETTKGDYMIDPKGRIYLLKDSHPATFTAMDREAGYDVDNEESLYTTGDNPLVRVSSFTYHPDADDPAGTDYNHSVNVEAYKGGVTRAQKTTIDRIRAAAKEAAREGWNVNHTEEVTTDYGGNYYVNMDAVTITDEPYRGMPLDGDISNIEVVDGRGLPINRLRPRPPSVRRGRDEYGVDRWNPSREYEVMDEAYNELAAPGEPSHPLISTPETTRDALERLSDMVNTGEVGNLPKQYISPRLLDQLATITSGTSLYHAPYDAVSNVGNTGPGYYDISTDRISVSSDVHPELYAQTVLHEVGHAATNALLTSDVRFGETMRDLLVKAVTKAGDDGVNLNRLPDHLYGLTGVHEIIPEMMANQRFRDFLQTVPSGEHPVITGAKNVANAIYRAILDAFRRVMGTYNGKTALDILFYDQSTVLGKADRMVQNKLKKMERTGRPAYSPVDVQQRQFRPGIEVPGSNRLYLGAGAKAFAADMAEGFGRAGSRMGYHLQSAVKGDKVRARGLDWMTTSDMTQIGSEEFRRLSENAFETMEKIFALGNELRDKDRKELKAIADIYNGWSKEARQDVAAFSIDLTMHGAFTGEVVRGRWTPYSLIHSKNRHVDPTSIAWEQVVQEHKKMQDRHVDLRQLPKFDEFLDRILKFGEQHEEQIRKARLRDLIKFSSFIPDNIVEGTPEHARLVDALERLISLEPRRDVNGNIIGMNLAYIQRKLSPADVALIQQHVDLTDEVTKELMRDLHKVPDIQKLQGPYLPLTRQGDWALSGEFTLPAAPNGFQLHGDVNRLTGAPIDEGKVAFRTKDEAKAYVKKVTEELGITQTDGGEVWIDMDSGQRPRVRGLKPPRKKQATRDPTKKAARAGENLEAENLALATDKQIQDLIDQGANIQKVYWVQFQRKVLTMHANEYEAQQAYEGWRRPVKEGGRGMTEAQLKLTEPKDVLQYDARQNEQYVSTAMQKLINHMRQSPAYKRLDAAAQSALTRVMTLASETYAMRRGVKQRYLPRGYVEGASHNILQSLDDYSAMATHYEAKVEHASELANTTRAQKEYITSRPYESGDRNTLAHQRVYNAMQKRIHAPKQNPRDTMLNRNVDRALRWTMLDKLPSIGYFTANATQAWAVAAPLMMGRHSPLRVASTMWQMYKIFGLTKMLRNAGHDLAQAIKRGENKVDYLVEMTNAVNASKLSPERKAGLIAMLEKGAKRGAFDRSGSIEYQGGFADNPNMVDRAADWAQGVFQGVNSSIEAMNRFVTLATAYSLEADKGTAHDEASRYAFRITHNSNGQYANYNAPERFNTGPIARMLFQFKKFPQMLAMNYIRGAQGVIGLVRGERTAENIERARQLAALLAVQFLLAGALGMPTELFAIPINTLHFLGFIKYNTNDISAGFRQWAADKFGVTGGVAVSHGMLDALTGLSISSRLSQSSVLTSGAARTTKPQDINGMLGAFFFGATASTGIELAQASQHLNQGITALSQGADDVAVHQFMKFGEKVVLFRTFADVMAASNGLTQEGMRGPSGRQRQETYGPFEFLARVAGFRPLREAESVEGAMAIRSATDRIKAERKAFSDNWARSTSAQQQQMWPTIQEWNKGRPPEHQLTRSELLRAEATRLKAEKQPLKDLGLATDRQMRPFLPMAKAYATGG